LACAEGRLDPDLLAWGDRAAACVVLAAANYPESPRRGDRISGLETAAELANVLVFHAGTEWVDGAPVTAGGRVLCVTGLGPNRRTALARAYEAVEVLDFDGMQYRRDIGRL
jgi:phosphoribosylamine---glycine ligase